MAVKRFLERLQSTDEATKRRYVMVSSACIMVVVIWIWFGYFNSLIQTESAQPENPPRSSVGETMKQGAATIYEGFIHAMSGIGGAVTSPKTYVVTPK